MSAHLSNNAEYHKQNGEEQNKMDFLFVYSRESDPWVIAFNIKKNQWIRDEERIDKVKNLESKLKSIKSNKDNIEGFLEKPDHIHNDYEGYRNLVTYYNIEIEKVTEKIKTHKRLLGMNIHNIVL